jgi:hypothetical protein
MLVASSAYAQDKPARNVSPNRHPNLAAAQKLSQQAFEKLVAAQRANEWDMGGHAQKAKELLEQANVQIKLAAETANRK